LFHIAVHLLFYQDAALLDRHAQPAALFNRPLHDFIRGRINREQPAQDDKNQCYSGGPPIDAQPQRMAA
jgi:hypothetical protein